MCHALPVRSKSMIEQYRMAIHCQLLSKAHTDCQPHISHAQPPLAGAARPTGARPYKKMDAPAATAPPKNSAKM